MDTDAYVYVKQRKETQDGQAVFFHLHKPFLCSDHVARQTTEAERKLQTSHYDYERKGWDWDKYITLHKEQHTIMESLTYYDYSRMNNVTKVCHFLQGIKSTKLEAVVNVLWVQPEKYGTDFDATVSYLSQMVMKKRPSIQSVCITKTRSQPIKVTAFMGKVECMKFPKAFWNSMTRAADAG